jgi:hypothetical protein
VHGFLAALLALAVLAVGPLETRSDPISGSTHSGFLRFERGTIGPRGLLFRGQTTRTGDSGPCYPNSEFVFQNWGSGSTAPNLRVRG